jgi:hypothetical protein
MLASKFRRIFGALSKARRNQDTLRPGSSVRFRQRVLEVIGMLARINFDSEIAGQAC